MEDFPPKYQEYMVVVQEREFQIQLRSKIMEARQIASLRAKVNICTFFSLFYLYIFFCIAI